MKATINESGMLTIKAETPIEVYALDHWWGENFNEISRCKNISIEWNRDELKEDNCVSPV